MRRTTATLDTPCHYEVVGEHIIDPARLLVVGDDGHFYTLDLTDGHTAPTELTDEWLMDASELHEKLSRMRLN